MRFKKNINDWQFFEQILPVVVNLGLFKHNIDKCMKWNNILIMHVLPILLCCTLGGNPRWNIDGIFALNSKVTLEKIWWNL